MNEKESMDSLKDKFACIDICNNSKPPAVDGRCKTEPWKRVYDQYGCPYDVEMEM